MLRESCLGQLVPGGLSTIFASLARAPSPGQGEPGPQGAQLALLRVLSLKWGSNGPCLVGC